MARRALTIVAGGAALQLGDGLAEVDKLKAYMDRQRDEYEQEIT
jgi:hypothetical protein